MDITFGLELTGKMRVSERGDRVSDYGGSWEVIELLEDTECSGLTFDIGFNEDGIIVIGISGHHVENEKTGRVFHAGIDAALSVDDIRAIRRYLGLLLKIAK